MNLLQADLLQYGMGGLLMIAIGIFSKTTIVFLNYIKGRDKAAQAKDDKYLEKYEELTSRHEGVAVNAATALKGVEEVLRGHKRIAEETLKSVVACPERLEKEKGRVE